MVNFTKSKQIYTLEMRVATMLRTVSLVAIFALSWPILALAFSFRFLCSEPCSSDEKSDSDRRLQRYLRRLRLLRDLQHF